MSTIQLAKRIDLCTENNKAQLHVVSVSSQLESVSRSNNIKPKSLD